MSAPTASAAYIVGTSPVRLWGLDGTERLTRQLRSAGVRALRPSEAAPPQGSIVLLRGDYLFDDRTIKDLLGHPGVVITNGAAETAIAVAAHVPARDLAVARAALEGAADSRAIPGVVAYTPESLSTSFVKKLHKSAPPVALPVRVDRVPALERHLFDSSYKGVTDLVTKWVWPAPARAVVRVCARLGIPPNAVTAVNLALVVVATGLFAQGRFAAGLALAWVMTFLDTVDGKLARVTVTSTTAGHYFDHTIDSVHPPIWYLAWAWGLPGSPDIWTLAPLLVAMLITYIAGRAIESGFKRVVGIGTLFTWRPFDSYFRLVMARRNPNLLLLTGFLAAGKPAAGLVAVAVWTVVSTVILGIRLLQGAYARTRNGAALRPWIEELGEESGPVPAWAQPFVADLAAVRHLVH